MHDTKKAMAKIFVQMEAFQEDFKVNFIFLNGVVIFLHNIFI